MSLSLVDVMTAGTHFGYLKIKYILLFMEYTHRLVAANSLAFSREFRFLKPVANAHYENVESINVNHIFTQFKYLLLDVD